MSGKNFEVVARGIQTAPLIERLDQAPELWRWAERNSYPGSAHAEGKTILLRWAKTPQVDPPPTPEAMVNLVLSTTEAEDYPASSALMPEAGEAVMAILERLRGYVGEQLGHVMLTRLPPGGRIARHTDEGVYADLYDRFHLCLAGDEGNTFRCGGETYHPKPGEAFWFNHKREHEVENAGALARVHLIVDVMAPEYTAQRGQYIQAEQVSDLWDEAEPLLQAHYEEIAHYQDIPLYPDKEAYQRLEDQGQLRCYTLRDGGHLVGYVVFIVRRGLHYRTSIQANQDVLFVLPAARYGLAGVRLIKEAERRLAAEGVQVVYHHAKRKNKVGELLERIGYEPVDGIWAKRLDRKE